MKTKLIGDTYYYTRNRIHIPYVCVAKSTRSQSWITFEQISFEYPQFLNKCASVLFNRLIEERTKDYVRSILFYLEVDRFISWKQFDSVFFVYETYEQYKRHTIRGTTYASYEGIYGARRSGFVVLSGDVIPNIDTDQKFDIFHERVFGMKPMFEEEIEDGMSVHYRDDGSRYFALPTDEDMENDFLGLALHMR